MPLLTQILSNPTNLTKLDRNQWQLLLAQANSSQLVGRINYLMEEGNYTKPTYVKWHLESAYKIAEKQRTQTVRELLEISQVLTKINAPLIFLKGAAYIAKSLPCSYGRTMNDIDILVIKSDLPRVELVLKFHSWLKSEITDYDEKYYRTWMHEIPPLYHAKRGTVLDLHHNILPITNKHSLDANNFCHEKIIVEDVGEINTLDDIDLCIHMAVHLFTESEFQHGLRDISDFDMLLRHFGKTNNDFVQQLITRSQSLGLYDYTRLAIRYAYMIFSSPTGQIEINQLENEVKQTGFVQDFCFINIFKPNHSSCKNWKMSLAKYILYWRGHLLRMPVKLLIPHLLKKSFMQTKDYFQKDKSGEQMP